MRLNLPRKVALFCLAIFAIAFGINVELRGALLHERHTDAGAYFTAAWSIRTGSDPYDARDRNGWHYTYPPLLAVLLAPLADAPPGMHRYWLIPYPVSIGVWYALSILFLVVGVDQLAQALVAIRFEKAANRSGPWWTPWWTLFFWPILFCLPVICRSVVRGQVGPLWLMLLCMATAALVRKKPFQAGLWIAASICLKLIPLFLLLYPIWRRSGRMLAGCAVGLLAGLIAIPALALGPKQFIAADRHYLNSIVIPGLTGGRIDPAVEHELINPVTSDTQSLTAVLMNIGNIFFGTERSYTPPMFARIGQWMIAGILIGMTLYSAGWNSRKLDPVNEAMFFSILCVLMLPIAPTCHPHYFLLMIPLMMSVLATSFSDDGKAKREIGWIVLLTIQPIAHALTFTTGHAWMQFLRDTGLVLWTALAFCVAAMVRLNRRRYRLDNPV